MRKYYRVVSTTVYGGLYTLNSWYPAQEKFEINKWVTAPIGGYLVFTSLRRARRFVEDYFYEYGNMRPYRIYSCYAEDPIPFPARGITKKLVKKGDTKLLCDLVFSLWENGAIYLPFYNRMYKPKYSLVFRKVKLLEEAERCTIK